MRTRGGGQRSGGEQQSGRRRLLLLTALAAWVAVILIAAGREPTDPPLVGVENLDAILLVAVILFALLGLAILIIVNPFQSEWKEPGRRPGSYGYLVLLLGALALLFWRPQFLDDILAEREDTETVVDGELADLLAGGDNQPPPETIAEATDILILVVIVGAIVGAVFLFKNRTPPPSPVTTEAEFEAELIAALDEAKLELSEDSDPRSAVLNAYRGLEVVLESKGSSRARSETTTEHITRALRSLTIDPAPIAQLAALYEIARFSDQPITVDQQASARAALEQSTAELRRQA